MSILLQHPFNTHTFAFKEQHKTSDSCRLAPLAQIECQTHLHLPGGARSQPVLPCRVPCKTNAGKAATLGYGTGRGTRNT